MILYYIDLRLFIGTMCFSMPIQHEPIIQIRQPQRIACRKVCLALSRTWKVFHELGLVKRDWELPISVNLSSPWDRPLTGNCATRWDWAMLQVRSLCTQGPTAISPRELAHPRRRERDPEFSGLTATHTRHVVLAERPATALYMVTLQGPLISQSDCCFDIWRGNRLMHVDLHRHFCTSICCLHM